MLTPPELRITPAGTPVLRFTVDCGAPGEELRLGIMMTGQAALALKPLLEPGREVKVIGKLIGPRRALKGGSKTPRPGDAFEVVAASIELTKPTKFSTRKSYQGI